jgi:hypothetical protein
MNNHPDNTDLAHELATNGYIPVAMLPGTKLPAEKAWQEWHAREITADSIERRWRGTRNGVALLCHNLVVLDVDDADRLGIVLEKCGLTDAPICRTPRGGYHVHARARKGMDLSRKIKLHGRDVDLLTGESLSILPPHTNEQGAPYEWITPGLPPISELPLARLAWTRERIRRRVVRGVDFIESDAMVRRARAYLATVEGTISGTGGCHNRTFRVACVLAHKFGLSFEQAWPLFLEWNEQCEPIWSDRELRHKLEDALKKR